MAWVESDQSMSRDVRTTRLVRRLGIDLPAVVGHLHLLWWWALDDALDGDVSRYRAEDLADAAGWPRDPEAFAAALLDAEWLTRDGDGVHLGGWSDRISRLLDKRARDRAYRYRQSDESQLGAASTPTRRRDEAASPRTGPDRDAAKYETAAAAQHRPVSGGEGFDDLAVIRAQADADAWERLSTRYGVEPVQQARRRTVYRQHSSTDWPYVVGILRS